MEHLTTGQPSFTMEVSAGGKAMTVTIAFSCGAFECSEGFAEQIVQSAQR